MRRCEFVDNITWADVAIKIKAKSFFMLIDNLLFCFSKIITGKNLLKGSVIKKIKFDLCKEEELLLSLIDELIYYKDVKGILFFKLETFKKSQGKLILKLRGERVKNIKDFVVDVKGLSLHQFTVKKTKKYYETILVFDV